MTKILRALSLCVRCGLLFAVGILATSALYAQNEHSTEPNEKSKPSQFNRASFLYDNLVGSNSSAPLLYLNHLQGQKLEGPNQSPWNVVLHRYPDDILGATLEPIGDTLRSQLMLGRKIGLVVSSLSPDGPASQAGLKPNDVLLHLADKPLATVDDFTERLKETGENPISLKVLRAGKPIELRVRPIYKVTLGPVAADGSDQTIEYFVGFSSESPSDTVRAQLELPDGQGLVATSIVADSPAEKAGMQISDILLEVDGKPIDTIDTFRSHVQSLKNKPISVKVLRAGKTITLSVIPAPRKITKTVADAALLWAVQPHWNAYQPNQGWNIAGVRPDPSLEGRLNSLESELKAVRKALQEVAELLKTEKAKSR